MLLIDKQTHYSVDTAHVYNSAVVPYNLAVVPCSILHVYRGPFCKFKPMSLKRHKGYQGKYLMVIDEHTCRRPNMHHLLHQLVKYTPSSLVDPSLSFLAYLGQAEGSLKPRDR